MTAAELERIISESTPEAAAEIVAAALFGEPDRRERLDEVFAMARAVCDDLKGRFGSTPPLHPDLVRWLRFRVHLIDACSGWPAE